jgi:hypothetical protein
LGKARERPGFQSDSRVRHGSPRENDLHIDRKALNYNKHCVSSSPRDGAAPMAKE